MHLEASAVHHVVPHDCTKASGAFLSSVDGSSGFRDLGYVFPKERGANSNPPHPDHPGPGATTFAWDVGALGIDDATSATPMVTAAGLDDGAVTVSLEVGDGAGTFQTDTTEVIVVNAPPVVAMSPPPSVTPAGAPVGISATFTDAGVLDTHTVSISWGDGSTCDGSAGSECSIAGADGVGSVTGAHVYAVPGTYSIVVTVTDDDGGVGATEATPVYVGSAVQTAAAWAATTPWPLPDPIVIGGAPYTRDDGDHRVRGGHQQRSESLPLPGVGRRALEPGGRSRRVVCRLDAHVGRRLAGRPPAEQRREEELQRMDGCSTVVRSTRCVQRWPRVRPGVLEHPDVAPTSGIMGFRPSGGLGPNHRPRRPILRQIHRIRRPSPRKRSSTEKPTRMVRSRNDSPLQSCSLTAIDSRSA
jgi:PKD repeat protein